MDDECNEGKGDYSDIQGHAFRRALCPLFNAETNRCALSAHSSL